MSDRATAKVFSIPPGVPFLPTLADALMTGRLVPSFRPGGDPLALADVTIYLPTRRAARALRSVFVDRAAGAPAILPTIRALGEFAEEEALFEAEGAAALDLAPPIAPLDRLLLLAPLVQAWKSRLPAHLARLYEERVVVPASAADAIWFARDLAALIDEMETESADWRKLAGLVDADLAGWWQVTLEFLDIVSSHWPAILKERERSNPAWHRNALIRAEAARLKRNPPPGPVVAAGSTGSIPATATLLSTIARLPHGALVLPGLDLTLDERAWAEIGDPDGAASICGHPQYGLRKLLGAIGVGRGEVEEIGRPAPALDLRRRLLSDALRPAETTDAWAAEPSPAAAEIAGALADVSLVEAANERDEALAIAVALRGGLRDGNRRTALVTTDRALARRVSSELLRFGIRADDSGGTPLAHSPAAILLGLALETAFRPGDPVTLLSLLKHPLLFLGMDRARVRAAAETIDLVALRGGTGRPDAATLAADFDRRLAAATAERHQPFWLDRVNHGAARTARAVCDRLETALRPLLRLRGAASTDLAGIAVATVEALEALARQPDGSLGEIYAGHEGTALAAFLRSLVGAETALAFDAGEWPDIVAALIATETVKPAPGADDRVAIWGALEARLQDVDLLVIAGLNEGTWPRKAEADRFMSRLMRRGVELEPPERRLGLAAHDFAMAMGSPCVVLTRSARTGDAPSMPSRWLQRLLTRAGSDAAAAMRARGAVLLDWAHALDRAPDVPFAARPEPKPPVAMRPHRFSVTEIETLRRDPYAVYARRVLGLEPLDPLLRDPEAAERGSLFHEALSRFVRQGAAADADPVRRLLAIGQTLFDEAALPAEVAAVWWPRFERMAANFVAWEQSRVGSVVASHAEIAAERIAAGSHGDVISGRADRIDLRADGTAEVLDYKTGSSPSKGQAHVLLAPQLALEGALLKRGAFLALGMRQPSDLLFVRMKASGEIVPESILSHAGKSVTAAELAEDAWRRLGELLDHYHDPSVGYLSRALPFREGDLDGDYDHLARVLEWSAGAGTDDGAA